MVKANQTLRALPHAVGRQEVTRVRVEGKNAFRVKMRTRVAKLSTFVEDVRGGALHVISHLPATALNLPKTGFCVLLIKTFLR